MTHNVELLEQRRERWHLAKIDDLTVKALAEHLGVEFIVAKILLARHIGKGENVEIEKFLNPDPKLLTEYRLLTEETQLTTALNRVKKALLNNEKILVNGDPDADGISGTTILVSALRFLKADVAYDFPVRGREGHGLQVRIIDQAKQGGVGLIITTDCGSKDIESTAYAKEQGIDVIITDHHILSKKLPDAYAIVNPHLVKEETIHKALSGAGVAYKFILGLFDTMNAVLPKQLLEFFIGIATLGTLSDRMSLLDPVNRMMVNRGAKAIERTDREGLKAIKRVCIRNEGEIKPRHLSRSIIPRLNAPGRIGDPQEGIPDSNIVVDLLLLGAGKHHAQKAEEIAEKFSSVLTFEQEQKVQSQAITTAASVDDVNERRKFITNKIEEEMDQMVEEQIDPNESQLIVIKGKNWNPGVIGIDTDRLKERFLLPAMIVTEYEGSDYLRGSVRSIPNIDMYHVLERVSETFFDKENRKLFLVEMNTNTGPRLVDAFGGHAQACGFTLHKNDLEVFKAFVREEMSKLKEEDYHYSYDIIDKIPFSQLTERFIRHIDKLMPFGQRFEYPIFYLQGCGLSPGREFGNKYQELHKPHVKFTVIENPKKRREGVPIKKFQAVAFNMAEKFNKMKANLPKDARYDVIFTADTLPANKRKRHRDPIELNVLDIRESGKNVDSFLNPADM